MALAMATQTSPQSFGEPAIRIDNLTKRYAPPKGATGADAEGKLALGGVSFDVPEGSIFGLLGPNGAGKSTLINILAGLVNKTSGSAEIWGFDIDQQRRNASRAIGIVPQEIVFDPFFTPYEVLENQGGFYGIPAALEAQRGIARSGAAGGQAQRLCAHFVWRDEAAPSGGQSDGALAPDPCAR